MPIYEYHCKKCGHVFEALQRSNEDGSKLRCPVCDEPAPEKLFSSFASTGTSSNTSFASSSSGCGGGGFS